MNLISLAHVNCGKTFLVHWEAPPVPQTRTVLDEASVATIRVGRLTALTKIQKMVRKAISSCCHKEVLLSDMFDSVKTTFRTKLDFSEFHRFDICATCTLISLGHNRAKISVRTCAIWIFLAEQANVWKGEHSEKLFSSPDPCAGKKCGHGEICLRDGPRSRCLCPPRCIGNRPVPRVCGTDGITYKNLCELLRTACIIGDTTLKMKHLHRCGSKPVVKPTTTTPPITQSPTGKLNNTCIACV